MTSYRRTYEPGGQEVAGSTAGATATRDLARVAMPGHPVKEGAGYDCACGECLVLRSEHEPESVGGDPDPSLGGCTATPYGFAEED